ncbi:MAG: type IV pilin protein, partial [Pseudomonadota bacterium]
VYRLEIQSTQLSATTYLLRATPVGPQLADKHCGGFELDQAGRVTVGIGTDKVRNGDDAQECW